MVSDRRELVVPINLLVRLFVHAPCDDRPIRHIFSGICIADKGGRNERELVTAETR